MIELSLEATIKFLFLLGSLEATMAKLGRCVDKLQFDLLKSNTRCLLKKRLPEGNHPLFRANTATLDQNVIILHHTVVREATDWSNVLLSPDIFSNIKIQNKRQNRRK